MTGAVRVEVPVSYRREWDDGFGARGWKLDAAIEDPAVIAATAETGSRIPTSVLVHDVLDHWLCGLPLSGHRNEAAALYQLSVRTGSDPGPDFAQMVDEDLMHGRANGEPVRDFLPSWLLEWAPAPIDDDRKLIETLTQRLGAPALRQALILRFFELGAAYAQQAVAEFERAGLDYTRRTMYGEGLQQALRAADDWVLREDIDRVRGRFVLETERCSLDIEVPESVGFGVRLAGGSDWEDRVEVTVR